MILSRAARRSSSEMVPFWTLRASPPLTVASPALMRSSSTSCRRTCSPASAQTWAMPLPIWPAPTTPTVLMSIVMCPAPTLAAAAPLTSRLGQLLLELRQELEQIPHEAVVGDLEDRRLLVLVDGDDDLGILHACQMLNGA